jgi:hypothetical protein
MPATPVLILDIAEGKPIDPDSISAHLTRLELYALAVALVRRNQELSAEAGEARVDLEKTRNHMQAKMDAMKVRVEKLSKLNDCAIPLNAGDFRAAVSEERTPLRQHDFFPRGHQFCRFPVFSGGICGQPENSPIHRNER